METVGEVLRQILPTHLVTEHDHLVDHRPPTAPSAGESIASRGAESRAGAVQDECDTDRRKRKPRRLLREWKVSD